MKKLDEASKLYESFLTQLLGTFPAMRLGEYHTGSSTCVRLVHSPLGSRSPVRRMVLTKLPLINFCGLALLTVRRTSRELYNALLAKYSQHLAIEPSLRELAQQVLRVYFPQPGFGSGLAGLFQSLLGGGSAGGSASPNATLQANRAEDEDDEEAFMEADMD